MARTQELTLTRGNRGLLLLAVLSGLVAAALVFVALAQNDGGGGESASPAASTFGVVVASHDIPAGTEVSADMVKVVDVPEALLVKGAFSDATPVVGEVTRYALAEGEQITATKVGAPVEGEGLGSVVPKGKRAVAIRVEEATAVGGLLLPGDRVDVVAAFQSGNDAPVVVQTVLQDVEVLAVAQEAQQPVPVTSVDEGGGAAKELATSGRLPSDVDTQPDASTVTLAVDPQQAEILAGAQQAAKRVWLSLRPFGETSQVDLPKEVISSSDGR